MHGKRGMIVMDSVLYVILALAFFAVMFLFVSGYQEGAAFWEDFYAKEIVYLINRAEPGMEFDIDVTRISEIALGNGRSVKDIFSVNNAQNTVTVSLRETRGTSFKFFNNVEVVDWKVELVSRGPEKNSLKFKLAENLERSER